MKLIVFGASGACGQWAVRLAAQRGWSVTAFVREQTSYTPPPDVRVVRGDVLNGAHVAPVMQGHDAVLSCLGAQRVSPINPWSPLRSRPDFCVRSAERLIEAAKAAGIQRIGAISAAGVGDSATALPLVMRVLLAHSTVGVMYRDLEQMEAAYAASGLDWFAVRPVTLINAQPSARARIVRRFRNASVIGRADVVQWMLDALVSPVMTEGRTPILSWW